ncbi:hypothetical protein BH18ACT9_BH18ACT9_06110 [soil metagenome]
MLDSGRWRVALPKLGQVTRVAWKHMAPTFALLPSPLLGAAVWEPVAGELRTGGVPTVVLDVPGAVGGPDDVIAAFLAALPSGAVLVPHSNSGYLAPALAVASEARATVFVDAALPWAAGSTSLAPPQFLDFLTGLADDDGVLPPWTQWWDDTAALFPTEASRRRVEAEQSLLPLEYFRSRVGVPEDWFARPCAYLGFGEVYAEELRTARLRGWPTRTLDGRHLHMLHDPVGVAHAILELEAGTERSA